MLSTSKVSLLSYYYNRIFACVEKNILKVLNASELLSDNCAYAYFLAKKIIAPFNRG